MLTESKYLSLLTNLFYITLIEITFSEAIARSLRSNKEMVAALLTDYKSQDFDDSAETLPVALPLQNKYENRYENNEIRRYDCNYTIAKYIRIYAPC